MMPTSMSASASATSGVNGDSQATSPTEYYNTMSFAVGRANAESSAQGGAGGGLSPTLMYVGAGVALVGVVVLAAVLMPRRNKSK